MSGLSVLLSLFLLTFPINSENFTSLEKDLRHYAWLSSYTFCDDPSLNTWSCKECYRSKKPVELEIFNNDTFKTRGFLSVDDDRKEIDLVFRGSEYPLNYLYDIYFATDAFLPARDRKVRVHRGFSQSLDSLVPQVYPSLIRIMAKYPDYPLVLTGHSLGGAMASLMGAYLVAQDNINVRLYTFGQPKTGNRPFSIWFNNLKIANYRVVNKNDIVPHIRVLDHFDYSHHNHEIWIQENDELKICNDELSEDVVCSDSVPINKHSFSHHVTYFDTFFSPKSC